MFDSRNGFQLGSLRVSKYFRKSLEAQDRQVLSIPAQERELGELAQRLNLRTDGAVIIDTQTARKPGRPGFTKLMHTIDKGEVDAILCWKLDRLARNPLDGGSLMWLLGEGKIKCIITPGRIFTGSSDDKLLMAIEFGMATKYTDDISENVRRGNREALESGLWPGAPKIGYMRDHVTNRLVHDPVRFALVERMWRLRLEGVPILEIWSRSRAWGLTTTPHKRRGGKPISASYIYDLFRDPFYAGVMTRKGQMFDGSHPPMVTLAEFERIQRMFRGTYTPRGNRYKFPFRGLIGCGRCGAMLTAEKKQKKSGLKYLYYHCCRKKRKYGFCPEPSIETTSLCDQVGEFFGRIYLPREVLTWFEDKLPRIVARDAGDEVDCADRLERELQVVNSKIARLRDMCAEGKITDLEFSEDRSRLLLERGALEDRAIKTRQRNLLEPFREDFLLSTELISRFRNGSDDVRHDLLRRVASNATVENKKLTVQAKNPFILCEKLKRFRLESGTDEELRTLVYSTLYPEEFRLGLVS
jgi:site-specific DNA recombinase